MASWTAALVTRAELGGRGQSERLLRRAGRLVGDHHSGAQLGDREEALGEGARQAVGG